MNWDDYFIKLCYVIAEKSKDRSTQVGCVIVGPDHEIRSTGFNGLPRGVIDKTMDIDEYAIWLTERGRTSTTSHSIMPDGSSKSVPGKMEEDLEKLNAEIERRYEERPYKYKWVAHSEFNAVCNAARTGTPLNGCTIYVPWLPCSNCAMAIIQAGIVEVVMDGNFEDDPELMKRWEEEHRITKMMFEEAGILVRKTG